MKTTSLLLCAATLILCGCAPSVVLNKNWSHTQPEAKSLAIILLDGKIRVNYIGNVENEFGKGDMNTLIRRNIRDLFCRRIKEKTCFHDVWFDQLAAGIQTTTGKATDGVTMVIPKDRTEVMLEKSQADYILGFDNVSVASSIVVTINGNIFAGGSYSKYLNMSTRFYIWDIKQRCLVVSGYTSNKDENGNYTDMKNWIKIIDITVNELFEKTPFLVNADLRQDDELKPGEELLEKP